VPTLTGNPGDDNKFSGTRHLGCPVGDVSRLLNAIYGGLGCLWWTVGWCGIPYHDHESIRRSLGGPVFCGLILDAISSEPFDLGNNVNIRKTCSVGWASYPWCGEAIEAICPEEAIELADAALYDAKASGKNQSAGYVPSGVAIASPERINFASIREERSSLIKTIRTSTHCRPNWTGSGSGDVENKVVDVRC
jgi:hypothetical protein